MLTTKSSYIIFVHLLDENGNLVGQIDELPFRGQWPTNKWRIGSKLTDRHMLPLDSTLLPGEYTISVGLYNPVNLERLSAQSEGNPVIDNAVALTQISICRTCPDR